MIFKSNQNIHWKINANHMIVNASIIHNLFGYVLRPTILHEKSV